MNYILPGADPELSGFIGGSTLYFTIIETGLISRKEVVETPAGKFEDCLKIEYRTETVMPKLQGESGPEAGEAVTTVWLAPNIGIVKFHQEAEKPIFNDLSNSEFTTQVKTFELKKYEIKNEASETE